VALGTMVNYGREGWLVDKWFRVWIDCEYVYRRLYRCTPEVRRGVGLQTRSRRKQKYGFALYESQKMWEALRDYVRIY